MPRRRVTQSTAGVIMGGIGVVVFIVISLLSAIWKSVQGNPWIAAIPILVVALVIVGGWSYNRRQLQRIAKQEEEDQLRREQEEKEQEQKRVNEILARKDEWGNEMSQWLIENKYRLTDPRTAAIMDKYQEWGKDSCQNLMQKRIGINDTSEMVSLALGEPTSIDEQTLTEKEAKFRWIYGMPRRGATYIWFKNGKVTKIKQ